MGSKLQDLEKVVAGNFWDLNFKILRRVTYAHARDLPPVESLGWEMSFAVAGRNLAQCEVPLAFFENRQWAMADLGSARTLIGAPILGQEETQLDITKIEEATLDDNEIREVEKDYAALSGEDRRDLVGKVSSAEAEAIFSMMVDEPSLDTDASELQASLDNEAPEITKEGYVVFPETFVDLDPRPGCPRTLEETDPTPPPVPHPGARRWGDRVAVTPTERVVLGHLIGLPELSREIHEMSVAKGWWEDSPLDPDNVQSKLALAVSELSEAIEAIRDGALELEICNGKPEGFVVEMADAVIRLADLAAATGADLVFDEKTYQVASTCPSRPGFLNLGGNEITVNRAIRAISLPIRLIAQTTDALENPCVLLPMHTTMFYGILIRTTIVTISEICTWLGVDLGEAIRIKHGYNKTRAYRHGGRLA